MEIDPNAPHVVQLSCFSPKKSFEMATSNVVLLVWNCPFMNTPFFRLPKLINKLNLHNHRRPFWWSCM